MINLDSELAAEYLAESHEHLVGTETDLLALERGGAQIDEELVSRVFRAVHFVQGGAGVFSLVKIGELARQTENVLLQIRSHKMVPTQDRVRVLLGATDRLQNLIQNPGVSNQADIAELMAALGNLCREPRTSAETAVKPAPQGGMRLRVLLVEDDFASRLLLQTFLSRYGECHIAVNGREAVEAVRSSLERGQKYDLICMDIMMPEMDGREAVRRVRALEEEHGIRSTFGSKIIMTTAVDDIKEVVRCFKELCDSYLMKPIDLTELLKQMKSYQLVQ
jgi:two-component system chemotaxis response regulator CheY